jgi:pyruvate dehydrogenase E2 component (dihydrolipoamide acetyltransferase)
MAIEFKLPELGENIEAADVVNVMINAGDTIQKDQAVLELETEKAVLELPCPYAGRIVNVNVKAGDHIPVGTVVLTVEPSEEAVAAPPAEKPEVEERAGPAAPPAETRADITEVEQKPEGERAAETPSPGAPRPAPPEPQRVPADVSDQEPPLRAATEVPGEDHPPAPAGPAVRRLAREMGVDLDKVTGTGPAGRITEADVHSYVRGLAQAQKEAPAEAPATGLAGPGVAFPPLPDFSQWGPVERQDISNVRRKTAEAMTAAWRMVPQVTHFDLCDITELEAQRKRYMQGQPETTPKITVTAFLLKAVAAALKEFPRFNASFDAQAGQLIYRKYVHVGVAVDTEHGLLVPVIRDVDRKGIPQLAKELDDVSRRARQRKLSLDEMRGSCFTITNLGGIGGTAFSPIVYWPEVAILGVARARQEYTIVDGAPQVRLMMPLCLSYDHRVIDGADAARFCRRLGALVSNPLALILES